MSFDMTREEMHAFWKENFDLPEECFADLERITAACRAQDDAMDQIPRNNNLSFEEVAQRLYKIHPEAIRHAAGQRALRMLGIQNWHEDRAEGRYVAALIAMWMDGLAVGINAYPRLDLQFSVIDGSVRHG